MAGQHEIALAPLAGLLAVTWEFFTLHVSRLGLDRS